MTPVNLLLHLRYNKMCLAIDNLYMNLLLHILHCAYSFLRMQTVRDNLESVPGVQSGTISELPFLFMMCTHIFKAVTLRQSNL